MSGLVLPAVRGRHESRRLKISRGRKQAPVLFGLLAFNGICCLQVVLPTSRADPSRRNLTSQGLRPRCPVHHGVGLGLDFQLSTYPITKFSARTTLSLPQRQQNSRGCRYNGLILARLDFGGTPEVGSYPLHNGNIA